MGPGPVLTPDTDSTYGTYSHITPTTTSDLDLFNDSKKELTIEISLLYNKIRRKIKNSVQS